MNKEDQITLVTELCDGMKRGIIDDINAGKIPESWDGHELRVLVHNRGMNNARISTIRKNPKSARAKDYANTTYLNNL